MFRQFRPSIHPRFITVITVIIIIVIILFVRKNETSEKTQ